MKAHFHICTCSIAIVSFGLVGCEDKKSLAEIEELKKDLEIVRERSEAWQEEYEAEEKENDKLKEENFQLNRQLSSLEGRAEAAERDLERFKAREEKAKQVKEREPSSREKLAAAKETALEQLSSMVTITGDSTSGSGTLVSADEKTWIYLPASAVIGNSRLEVTTSDGTRLEKFGAFELAADADLARLEVKDETDAALVPAKGSGLASGGTMLGVGDSGEIIEARVFEAGPKTLNAGSRFNASAAGTPVFSGESGELVGVIVDPAGADRELWPSKTYDRKVREVCRLDRTIDWSAVPIGGFMEEAKTLAEADRLTRLVSAFAATSPSTSGVSMSATAGGSTSVKEILDKNRKVPAVKALFELDEWLKERGERASQADIERQVGGTYGDMMRISSRSTKKFAAMKFSPYHADAAAQSLEWRKEAEKKLAATAKSFE